MTEEKLWEFWDRLITNRQVRLTEKAEKFLHGESDTLERFGSKKGGRYYLTYPADLIQELDGENRELARRMLLVISTIRHAGAIERYGWTGDARICAAIGYEFDEILHTCLATYYDNGANAFELAKLLLELFPQQALDYADGMLINGEDGLLAQLNDRKSNRGVYIRMNIACLLLLQDREKYIRFLPALETIAERISDEYLIVMLYHARTLSEPLKETLKRLIINYDTAPSILYRHCVPNGSFLDLLNSLDLPHYPYYMLVGTGLIPVKDRPQVFDRLYHEDREIFMKTYRHLAALSNYSDAYNSLGLLAIMLKNGDGQAELEEAGKRIPLYLNQLNAVDHRNGRFVKDFIMDDETPVEELASKLRLVSNIYGATSDCLCIYAAMYEYSAVARKLFHLLLLKVIKANDTGNLSNLYCCFLVGRKSWLGVSGAQSVGLLVKDGFDLKYAFLSYCVDASDNYGWRLGFDEDVAIEIVRSHEQEAIEFLKDDNAGREIPGTVAWITLLYQKCGVLNFEPLINLLPSKSKQVRGKCEEIINAHEAETCGLLEARAPKLKGDAAQAARRIIKLWDNERKFGKDFVFTDNGMVVQFCEDNFNSDNAKLIKWIPEDLLGDIRFADLNEKAPAIVAKYILVEYLSLTNPYRVKACDKVVERLHPQDWQTTLENIYQFWMEDGAEAKKKSILIPYCIYASDPQILRLKRQIEQWAEVSRGALGAYAVGVMALNGGSVALMMVDNMGVKFPNSQVKNAARAAFAYAAKALEVPEDVLSDRIVPNLGFSAEGEKVLDYGPRTFTVTLLPDFTLSIMDNEKGKAVKSLPKPGAKDDQVKAEAAKKEFSELKKQMKAVVQTQTGRLERVLMDGRSWSVDRWKALFVENAIMHRFATGLVWGVYEDGKLKDAFRYLDDGTFNTVDEEEFELPQAAQITLVHPIDLDQETLDAWKQQLEDYEVVQPVAQLSQRVSRLEDKDLDGKLITRYKGISASVGKLTGLAKKYNMVRGEVLDAGSYECFHLVDKFLDLSVQINFDYMYMGQGYDEMVPMGAVVLCRLPEDGRPEDDPKDNMILNPREVLPRFVCSVLALLDNALDR